MYRRLVLKATLRRYFATWHSPSLLWSGFSPAATWEALHPISWRGRYQTCIRDVLANTQVLGVSAQG